MRGVILAAGSGSRLRPLTDFVCKPLMPLYDKPLLYYPLATLMNAGIRDVMIVMTPQDGPAIERAIGDGSRWGMNIQYATQPKPTGPLEGLLLAEDFIAVKPVTLVFGDNVFVSESLSSSLQAFGLDGAKIFGKSVPDPERFGVIEWDIDTNQVIGLEEKPLNPKSNVASVGLYQYDGELFDRLFHVPMGPRGERDIVDLNISYMNDQQLSCGMLDSGDHFIDAGLFESLYEASTLVRSLQQQGQIIGSPEHAAFAQGWINQDELNQFIERYKKNSYGQSLSLLL